MILRLTNPSRKKAPYPQGNFFVVSFQGCLKNCDGCFAPDSRPIFGGEKTDTECIKRGIDNGRLMCDDGVVLTGGEPLLQACAALDIARFAKSTGMKVWLYTGYLWEDVCSRMDVSAELMRFVDVLVDGEYLQEQAMEGDPYRGSANQRVIDVAKSLAAGEVVPYAAE